MNLKMNWKKFCREAVRDPIRVNADRCSRRVGAKEREKEEEKKNQRWWGGNSKDHM